MMTEQVTINTIDLLEQMASDVSLQDENTLQAAIEQAGISEQEKALIIAQDGETLSRELQLDKLITAIVIRSPDEEDDEEEQTDQPEESIRNFG